MKDCISYSPRASLAITGICTQQMNIWEMIGEKVKIDQKTVKHTPLNKVQDAFITILAGGKGVVESNTRVKTDPSLSRAFGREGCADQSGISETLNQCTKENVTQMREAINKIYQKYSGASQHHYGKSCQLIDVDMSGMPAGRKGKGVTGGYFAKQKNKRGRQLGRAYATLYDEVVVDRLYNGKTQLNRCLQALVKDTQIVLNLNQGFRRQTIIRVDGGGGNDADINWLLAQKYLFLVKVTHWKRVAKLEKSVTTWHPDPKDPNRQVGWVTSPQVYEEDTPSTRQLAVRCLRKNGKWSTSILVFNMNDAQSAWLLEQSASAIFPSDPIWLAVYAYDKRGGGVETSIKGSKSGLGIHKRNKKSFEAQEMLLLLGQLAYNLIAWTRDGLAACATKMRRYGILRMVRDVFHISGYIHFDPDSHILKISLNKNSNLAAIYLSAFSHFLARDGTVANLRQI
jgi:hypothetical protein